MMKIILYLAFIYCVLLVMLTVFQRKIMYYPHKLDKDFEFPLYVPQLEEVFITCDDGYTIHGLFTPASENKPTLLIFHGNAGNITHRDFLLRGFNTLGYSALLIDYHGYGKSEGTPSEKNLYRDGKAALEWLRKEKNRKPEDIVLFGKSLGSGVAIELATQHSFKGLILESAFTSIVSVARSHFPYNCFPVSLMLLDTYDNSTKISEIHSPVFIRHGTEDTIIDKREGEKLFEQANMPKELYLIEGADHNNMHFHNPQSYWTTIAAWLEGLT
jgi:fermentation-respiration switch protein FrsA (DUF1100 family)